MGMRARLSHFRPVVVFLISFPTAICGQLSYAQQPDRGDISRKVQQAFERITSKPFPFRLPFTVADGPWNTEELKEGNRANTFTSEARFYLFSHRQISRYLTEGIREDRRNSARESFDRVLNNEVDGWIDAIEYEEGAFWGSDQVNIKLPAPFLEILMLQTASPTLKGFSPWNKDDFDEVYVDEWLYGVTVEQFRKIQKVIGVPLKDFRLEIDTRSSESPIFFIKMDAPAKKVLFSPHLVRALFIDSCMNNLRENVDITWVRDMPKPTRNAKTERAMARLYGTHRPELSRLRYDKAYYTSLGDLAEKTVNQYSAVVALMIGHELLDATSRLEEIFPEADDKCTPKGKEMATLVATIISDDPHEDKLNYVIGEWSHPVTAALFGQQQKPDQLSRFGRALRTLSKSCAPVS